MKKVRCKVTGRVQGVWFRGSTRDQAVKLGVAGHARNCADGSVEVFACGEDVAVDELVAWLHMGPLLARVKGVEVAPADDDAPPDFTVL